jgi:hypothetical protein
MVPCSFRVFCLATAIGATLGVCGAARADSQPVIAIPGHLGVPVMINGIDATGAEVFGDWGLSRPGEGFILIEGGTPVPIGRAPVRYFPTSSEDPGPSETKVAPSPPRGAPPARPAASTDFHQSWSAGANPGPMPEVAPSVIVVPSPPPRPDKVPAGAARP